MNYYLDTEFLEGTQNKSFLGINYGYTKPTIDLISIGVVSEDNRKYYAISNEFNLKEAWNRYDEKIEIFSGDLRNRFPNGKKYKDFWIRENVLFHIWKELFHKDGWEYATTSEQFTYESLEYLINKYGKSNKQIAEEIKEFVGFPNYEYQPKTSIGRSLEKDYPEFYVYYGDYDWVVFCWLFGKMINLPDGFPYYAKDIKQIIDSKIWEYKGVNYEGKDLKRLPHYPKQTNEHNALSDSIFNKELYEFLQTLK